MTSDDKSTAKGKVFKVITAN